MENRRGRGRGGTLREDPNDSPNIKRRIVSKLNYDYKYYVPMKQYSANEDETWSPYNANKKRKVAPASASRIRQNHVNVGASTSTSQTIYVDEIPFILTETIEDMSMGEQNNPSFDEIVVLPTPKRGRGRPPRSRARGWGLGAGRGAVLPKQIPAHLAAVSDALEEAVQAIKSDDESMRAVEAAEEVKAPSPVDIQILEGSEFHIPENSIISTITTNSILASNALKSEDATSNANEEQVWHFEITTEPVSEVAQDDSQTGNGSDETISAHGDTDVETEEQLASNITVKCPTCNRYFKASYFKQHLKTHPEKTFKCHLCTTGSTVFLQRSELSDHWKLEHGYEDPLPFRCPRCEERFADYVTMNEHLEKHDKRVFHTCDVCGFKFGKKEYWENHVRYIHPVPGLSLPTPPKPAASKGSKPPILKSTNRRNAGNKKLNNISKVFDFVSFGFDKENSPEPEPEPITWDPYINRNLILHFRPAIERYNRNGKLQRPIPDTIVEIRALDRRDDEGFTLSTDETHPQSIANSTDTKEGDATGTELPLDSKTGVKAEECTPSFVLDDQSGALSLASGEFLGFPEDIYKLEPEEEEAALALAAKEEEEEEEAALAAQAAAVTTTTRTITIGGPNNLDGFAEDEEADGVATILLKPDDHGEEGGGIVMDDDGAPQAFLDSGGQVFFLNPDGTAVLAPACGQLVRTADGQLIIIQTTEDGTTQMIYTDDNALEENGIMVKDEPEVADSQDAVQTLIDAVQELVDADKTQHAS